MESIFGMENMAREAATARMIQAYENEIWDFARVSNLVWRSFPMRRAWYCPLLVRLGNTLIAYGIRLILVTPFRPRFVRSDLMEGM